MHIFVKKNEIFNLCSNNVFLNRRRGKPVYRHASLAGTGRFYPALCAKECYRLIGKNSINLFHQPNCLPDSRQHLLIHENLGGR